MKCVNFHRRSIFVAAIFFVVAALIVFVPKANADNEGKAAASKTTKRHLIETYGKLPLSFEANAGQTSDKVKFLSRGSGYELFLTRSGEAALILEDSAGKESPERPADALKPEFKIPADQRTTLVLKMKIVGGAVSPEAAGLEQLAGHVNYFTGNDPQKWRTNVPTYARVNFHDVYPGVDLAYYGNHRQLEYDFIVAPQADPSSITMAIEGAKLSLNTNGDLILASKGKEIRFQKPVTYQDVDGARREISSAYVLKSAHQVGFKVAAYDHTRPLIIDPVLAYSTYLGGTGQVTGVAIAVDHGGNAFLTGAVTGTDFPTTPGAFQTTGTNPCTGGLGGGFCPPPLNPQEAFVTELNPKGTALVFSTYLGGKYQNIGTGIALDDGGNTYVTGYTDSSDFPTTPGAWQSAFLGSTSGGCMSCATYNSFVTKLNPSGNVLVYSTFLGGFADTQAQGIAVDGGANAYVTGFAGSGFPTTPGSFQTISKSPCCAEKGPYNAFVAKLNASGSLLVYATYVGGSSSSGDGARGIALDAADEAFIAGFTTSTDFPTTQGAFQTAAPLSSGSGFVSKLSADGSALVYSTYLGGTNTSGSRDVAQGIAVDSAGNAYVTGFADSHDFPTTVGAFQAVAPVKSSTFASSGFLTKLNTDGSGLVYSTYLGGSKADFGVGIALDSAGDAYVVGSSDSTDFPTTSNALQPTPPDSFSCCHAFVTALNPAGSALVYSSYIGGSTPLTQARAVTVDSAGNVYIFGSTSSTTFPTTPKAFQSTSPNRGSGNAAFIMKITGINCASCAAPK
jgi:hypothetical protein